ncbi:BQ5605_C009g05751 [Microbotryum silenes-dioicae]|uniref:BQ5605_C009g05751 protein n=1 Tax=Microbotryum silenes-dioicae TaxID=796604 RepID=A0A2X0MI73_9BASI|nr:BQ5605_C009g05751 [Microbotryum silenes-dioicae]
MASTQLSLLGQFPVELHSTVIERLSAQCESAEAYTLAEMVYRRDGTTILQDDHALRACAFRSASTEQSNHPAKRTSWSVESPSCGGLAALSTPSKLIRLFSSPYPSVLERSVQVLQKPEPARLSPEVLQRPVIECSIEDGAHPIALASAMGILFSRASNSVHVKVYQLFASTSSTEPLDSSHYIIQLYTQFGTTSTSATGASAGRGAGVGGVAGSTTGSGGNGSGNGNGSGSGSGSGGLTMQEQKVLATASLKKVQALLKGLVDVGRVE